MTLIVLILAGTSTATNFDQNRLVSMHRGQQNSSTWSKIIYAQTVDAPPNGREEVVIQNPIGVGTLQFQVKKVYPKQPHIVADNHFSGEEVMALLGSKGYGATMTNHCNRFLEGLKPYLHHEGVKADLGVWITSPGNGLLRVKTKWHVVQVRKRKL